MNILLTGATGFLGSHVLKLLLREGHTVSSILIADEWDIRKVMPVIFSKKWNSIHIVHSAYFWVSDSRL